MAEKFRFFDAVQDENGVYDREYNAQEFTDYFKALVTTGVMKGAGNELRVTANGSNMITKVDTGIAFLLGRYYENDSFKDLTHDTETLGNSRIDRIVVRMDLSTDARYVKTFIKKGVPSTNPIAPTLTQTANLYEISLAQVRVVGGQTFIAVNNVTDERGKDIICPWAGSNILPSFDDNALAEHIKTKASTAQEGHVRLNNTLTSTSTTEAATANAAKLLNDVKATRSQSVSLVPTGNASWNLNNSRYFKDEFGIVHFYLNAQIGQKTDGTFISTGLPVGYRPYTGVMQPFNSYNIGTPVARAQTISIDTGGNMVLNGAIQGDSNIAVGYFTFKTTV